MQHEPVHQRANGSQMVSRRVHNGAPARTVENTSYRSILRAVDSLLSHPLPFDRGGCIAHTSSGPDVAATPLTSDQEGDPPFREKSYRPSIAQRRCDPSLGTGRVG